MDFSMKKLVEDFAEALRWIDESRIPYRHYQPGVGPYGEPQLVKKSLTFLKERYPERYSAAKTRRNPDLFIPNQWALEFKIVRPFGDNDREAEHWSQNLLHPYAGNVSSLGDIISLMALEGSERKGIIVIAYEHDPPKIDLNLLVNCFEKLAVDALDLPLGERYISILKSLVHPVHQQAKVYGWEVEI